MGDSETTDRGCVQAPALQENTNYNKKHQAGGYSVLQQGGRQVESFRTHISNVKLMILSDQAIWKLNLHKWKRGFLIQM